MLFRSRVDCIPALYLARHAYKLEQETLHQEHTSTTNLDIDALVSRLHCVSLSLTHDRVLLLTIYHLSSNQCNTCTWLTSRAIPKLLSKLSQSFLIRSTCKDSTILLTNVDLSSQINAHTHARQMIDSNNV